MNRNNRKNSNRRKPQNRNPQRKRKQIGQRNRLGRIVAPVTEGTQFRGRRPQMSSRNGNMVLRHREPLGPVLGSVAFAITEFSVNPGLQASFPWLSKIAQNFESYTFNRIAYIFFTSSSSAFTGSVVMAPDYNSGDDAPVSLQQVETYTDVYRGLPWHDGRCNLTRNGKGTGMIGPRRYVRIGALPTGQDIKTYDVANLYIAREGQANGAQIGELWVEYEIELVSPETQTPGEIAQSGLLGNEDGTQTIANFFGTTALSTGLIGVTNALNVVTFTNLVVGGIYLISFQENAAVVTGTPTFGTLVGLTSRGIVIAGLIGTTQGIVRQSFLATATTANLTVAGTTVLTTPTNTHLDIAMYAPNTIF